MAEWPDLEELKQRLDLGDSDDWDGEGESSEGDETRLSRLLEAAIAWVKEKVGEWDEDVDVPTPSLAQAALERAVELTTDVTPQPGVIPHSESLLYGSRRRFGVA